MSSNHPYRRYENTVMWRVVEKAVKALVKNGDLDEKTARTHIVGYLTQALDEAGVGKVESGKVKVIRVNPDEEVLLRRVS